MAALLRSSARGHSLTSSSGSRHAPSALSKELIKDVDHKHVARQGRQHSSNVIQKYYYKCSSSGVGDEGGLYRESTVVRTQHPQLADAIIWPAPFAELVF
mmetsp:Transcript_21032/g.64273  ORF Transcript_21032/g.64273 Transcript_21032/m.64273 type:complete len:100 (+) Transcript_21032:312-611(+)